MKVILMKKMIFCLIFLSVLTAAYAAGEEYKGYLKTETAHFLFVFEPQDRAAAEELVSFCEEVYEKVCAYFGYYPDKIPVLVTGRIDIANGSYSPLPPHLTLYINAPSDYWLGSRTESWLKLLLTHELTHYVHLTYNRGFFAFFSRFFGKDIRNLNVFFLSGWAVEGITTVLETEYTSGGRGRNPFFEMLYKAPVIEDRLFSASQAAYSSSFSPSGRIYTAGYMIVDYITEEYGDDVFARLNRRFAAWPFGGMEGAFRKVTGRTYRQVFSDMVSYYQDKYQTAAGIEKGSLFTPAGKGDYYFSSDGDRGSYLYRKLPGGVPAVIRYDYLTGSEEELFKVYLSDPHSFDVCPDEKIILFTAQKVVSGNPAGEVIESDLYLYDIESRKKVQLSEGLRVFQPAARPGSEEAVLVQRKGPYSRLISYNLKTGSTAVLFEENRTNVYNPVFSSDGEKLVFVINRRGVQDLALLEVVKAPETRMLTQGASGVYHPQFADNDSIIFSSDVNGSLSLYKLNLKTGSLKLICEDPVGAYKGFSGDRGTFYASYSSDGWCIKTKAYEELESSMMEVVVPPSPAEFKPVKTEVYYDIPWPVLWFPFPAGLSGTDGRLAPGLSGFFAGQSLLGRTLWTLQFSLVTETTQPFWNFSLNSVYGSWDFYWNIANFYSDGDGGSSQQFDNSIEGGFTVFSYMKYANEYRLRLLLGGLSSFRAEADEPFGFLNYGDKLSASAKHITGVLSGISLSFGEPYNQRDYFSRRGFDLTAKAGSLVSEEALELNTALSAAWVLPFIFPHTGFKLGFTASAGGGDLRLFSRPQPRGLPEAGSAGLKARQLLSMDIVSTLALLDQPLPLGLNITNLGGALYAESFADSDLSGYYRFDDYIYAGAELKVMLGKSLIAFPAGLGFGVRAKRNFQQPVDLSEDSWFYIFFGTGAGNNPWQAR